MNEDRYVSSSDEEDMERGGTASIYNDLEVVKSSCNSIFDNHHAILFLYRQTGLDMESNWKVEQLENDVLQ